MSEPTFAECRTAARAVRGSELARPAIDSIRPRELTGVFRSRLPLAMSIRLAALVGGLLADRCSTRSPRATS